MNKSKILEYISIMFIGFILSIGGIHLTDWEFYMILILIMIHSYSYNTGGKS